jgi:hypothetical protein
MKRLIILAIILMCVAVFCPAQLRGRRPIQQLMIQLSEPNLTGPVNPAKSSAGTLRSVGVGRCGNRQKNGTAADTR